MTTSAEPPQRLRAAYVRRVHGVRGEVRAEMCGGDADRLTTGTVLTVESSARPLVVRSARPTGDGSVLLTFQGVDDADAAAQLRGEYLDVDVAAARQLGPDEWFVWQLTGLHVRSVDGADLGVVEDVEEAVASDVLVLRSGAEVRRLPMVRAFVKHVDLESRVITVEPQLELDA